MIEIFYTKFNKQLSQDSLNSFLAKLPQKLQEENKRYRRWRDRHSHLFGKLLLLEALQNLGFSNGILSEIKYNDFGRPYLPDSTLDFNISHSGDFVICALSTTIRLGIDIEEIKEIGFQDFKTFMDKDEWEQINSAAHPINIFFDYWAIKESIIKADGRGMSLPLEEIRIDKNKKFGVCKDKTWYLSNLFLDEGIASYLATNVKEYRSNLSYVNFYVENN